MNGGADLGGMMGFGPVVQEEDEPLFHAPWEARALGIVVALGACGQWNIDAARSAREDMHPGDYTRTPYYAIWLKAAKRLMVEKGMLTEAEIAQSVPLTPAAPIKRKLAAEDVDAMLAAGGPADRPATGTPAFAVGDQIRTINNHPTTHTRMARYARDKIGTITKVHGFHIFPDSNAQGQGEDPQWLYQVAFSARTLWGDQARADDSVTLDLWEPYLRTIS
ncbi:nitrile hydratase subunit beta [uncultured Sulfitobacter sp.]|jgi:nitrile hydratase|uniref:nitrile hydratase subunit beta n=1 Tax=uncultured Sulfitobacter sp. TaxID=191468 RepID=UPI0025960BCD|nr:nitrile hydratase subunit beta [uncultured Sulfitobacter sp.]